MFPRTSTSHGRISFPRTQLIAPVKSFLPLTPLTHLSSPHWHCYLTRNALPAQSDSHSRISITVLSTRFHRLRVPLLWSPVRLSQRCWDARSQERRPYLYILSHPIFDVRMLSQYPRKLPPPILTEKVCTLRTLPFNYLS